MTRRFARSRPDAERGSATVELPFVLGLIVVPFALVVLQLPLWVERKQAAADAAAEVARSYATGSDEATTARLLGLLEMAHGLEPGSLDVSSLTIGDGGDSLSVEVTVDFPTLSFGPFGSVGSTNWTARHVERSADFGTPSGK